MKRTDLMPHLPEHLPEGYRIERRAIGGDTAEGQVACRQSHFESPEKRPDVLVGGIVIQDVIEDPFVAAIINRRQNAEGAIIHFIGGDIARKIRQGPVKEVRVQARLRLFFPQPRPSSEWSQRGQRRDGRARGASSPDGRAGRLRPPAVPPDPSRGACTERRVAPDQRGPRESTCDTSYSNAANTLRQDPADTRG